MRMVLKASLIFTTLSWTKVVLESYLMKFMSIHSAFLVDCTCVRTCAEINYNIQSIPVLKSGTNMETNALGQALVSKREEG